MYAILTEEQLDEVQLTHTHVDYYVNIMFGSKFERLYALGFNQFSSLAVIDLINSNCSVNVRTNAIDLSIY